MAKMFIPDVSAFLRNVVITVACCMLIILTSVLNSLAAGKPALPPIPNSIGILGLKKIPVTAAIQLAPANYNTVYFKSGFTTGVTLQDKLENYLQQAFSQAFDELYVIRNVARDETAAVIIRVAILNSSAYRWDYADKSFGGDKSAIQTVNIELGIEVSTPAGKTLLRDKVSSGDIKNYVEYKISLADAMFGSIQDNLKAQERKMQAGLDELAPGALITAVRNAADKVSGSQDVRQYAATVPSKKSDPKSLTTAELTAIVQTAIAQSGKGGQKDAKTAPARNSEISEFSISDDLKVMGENDVAVIIGIEGYQNLPKSEYSYDDAKLVKDYFKALGIKERNIDFLADEKATRSAMEKSLEGWLSNKTKRGSRVFLYYSGHGAPDPATGEAFLVPYDGDPNYLSITGYPLKRLYAKLGSLNASEVVVILDSCFSGSGGRSVIAKGARPLVITSTKITIPPNMAVLSATQGAQISTSSTERGHGILTYYFLKAIKDGKRNISEIYVYLRPEVEDEAKALNVQQSPSLNQNPEKLASKFFLRK